MKPVIKICGITREDQAKQLIGLKADYLGFNFIPASKRYISPEKAGEIIKSLDASWKGAVGVFQNQPLDYVEHCATVSGIHYIQLHGDEDDHYAEKLKHPLIRVISVEAGGPLPDLSRIKKADWLLFDTKSGGHSGGTGHAFNWDLLKDIETDKPFFLAGGIGPDNIGLAWNSVKPQGFDLNSKVENSPGDKNIQQVKTALENLSLYLPE